MSAVTSVLFDASSALNPSQLVDSVQADRQTLEQTMKDDSLSSEDLLNFQHALSEVQWKVAVLSKVTSTTAKTIDGLIHTQ